LGLDVEFSICWNRIAADRILRRQASYRENGRESKRCIQARCSARCDVLLMHRMVERSRYDLARRGRIEGCESQKCPLTGDRQSTASEQAPRKDKGPSHQEAALASSAPIQPVTDITTDSARCTRWSPLHRTAPRPDTQSYANRSWCTRAWSPRSPIRSSGTCAPRRAPPHLHPCGCES